MNKTAFLNSLENNDTRVNAALEAIERHVKADEMLAAVRNERMATVFEKAGHWPVGNIAAVRKAAADEKDLITFVSVVCDEIPESVFKDIVIACDSEQTARPNI